MANAAPRFCGVCRTVFSGRRCATCAKRFDQGRREHFTFYTSQYEAAITEEMGREVKRYEARLESATGAKITLA